MLMILHDNIIFLVSIFSVSIKRSLIKFHMLKFREFFTIAKNAKFRTLEIKY